MTLDDLRAAVEAIYPGEWLVELTPGGEPIAEICDGDLRLVVSLTEDGVQVTAARWTLTAYDKSTVDRSEVAPEDRLRVAADALRLALRRLEVE